MLKYQILFKLQLQEKLQKMLEPNAQIPEQELYRLAHSIKGTAGTIELPEWYSEALRLLTTFKEDGQRVFDHEQMVIILEPLYELIQQSDVEPEVKETAPIEKIPFTITSPINTTKARTVLIIDDDIGLLTLLKDELVSQNFTVLATTEPEQGLALFYDKRPDCVVLDLVLPGMNGFELLAQIQDLCERHFIPVMIISASGNKETRMHGYAMGAEDFMIKPFDMDEFSLHVRRLTSKRIKLTELLLLDSVTGAYSMPFLERELERYQEQTRVHETEVSLIVIDLQGLRNYNKTYNFAKGDQLLRQVSDTIKLSLRVEDIWAHERAGRFYLLQPGSAPAQSSAFIDRILYSPQVASLIPAGMMRIRYGVVPVFATTDQSQLFDQVNQQLLHLNTALEQGKSVSSIPLQTPSRMSRSIDAKPVVAHPVIPEPTISNPPVPTVSVNEPLRLAIVDDDPLIRNILERQMFDLEQEYLLDIRVYTDGKEFLNDPWHDESAQYLLILDRMMPRINGMEVLSRLRGEEGSKYTVLMLTGVDDEQGITEAIRAGADDYMTKPFSMMELEARVRRLLNKVGVAL
ncbi:response regulator [Paenibacillus sp. PsM32]|uniref:response regulator n=1 Tax=Paenibacillus sp. PsM32 TaxID=3030536 RepID=UPI00263B9D3A|nr:response regulator [Paenibacillus sp. PsM32]MDN4620296.1 response regulator [Paenibacillus sp. PsM32]